MSVFCEEEEEEEAEIDAGCSITLNFITTKLRSTFTEFERN